MSTAEPWTIARLLQWTTGFLKERGADTPKLDAEVLLAHALKCERIMLYARFTEVLVEPMLTEFRGLVKRRATGMPVAYLVGNREFFSLDFTVTPDVLIPRPDTEFAVVGLVDAAKTQKPAVRKEGFEIADVGTGSGILAICGVVKIPGARATAIDIEPGALNVARGNAEAHGVSERIEFIESDLFARVPPERKFDFIVSNPPYITTAEMADLDRDVREFEPHRALEAGPLGTEIIERLVPQAAERLVPGGRLFIEISPQLNEAVGRILAADPRLELLATIEDHGRRPRIAQARRRN
ncbi:MAG: peptide chain release factor N(5)-glutamine methyltransferase [Planctomycetia bacterium]|nr:peptide chain release factor N(5)-glutamine methyltransferase [Planctomycetia bacterium]